MSSLEKKSTGECNESKTPEISGIKETVNYPFGQTQGRENARLLFDFSLGVGAFDADQKNLKVLDFACGTGWTSEWLNKFGFDVYAFDVDPKAIQVADQKLKLDVRIDKYRFHMAVADGHALPYEADFFGQSFCFDSLHHIKDYEKALTELRRVLISGGRAVFVEPGSRHSTSPETVKFLKEHNFGDWWVEKDVDLVQIWDIAQRVGFKELRVKPFFQPSMVNYSLWEWYNILDNPEGIKNYMTELRRYAFEDRVVFYLA